MGVPILMPERRAHRLLIVLEVPQVLLAEFAIVRRHPMAVVRIDAGLRLVSGTAPR
jgi:hypothetical protein